MNAKHFIAFDLGATSGRTILGTMLDGKLTIEELTRFANAPVERDGHIYWDIFGLCEHLKQGLRCAADKGVKIESAGIDTWGVDFAFVGEDGQIHSMPFAYRDRSNEGMPEDFFAHRMPREQLYELTGIQIMNFNSLFQLHARRKENNTDLNHASRILFMPDALAYMLTSKAVAEYTIATTSQMIDPYSRQFDSSILQALGIDGLLFAPIVMPGTVIGTLSTEIQQQTGMGAIPVVAVAGHDTASAVAAIPAEDDCFAFLSSGTWSLLGIELDKPLISPLTSSLNLTNEGGIDGTTELLKNMTGMWILEQCMKEWKKQGKEYTYPQIVAMAKQTKGLERFIDTNATCFDAPPSMIEAIDNYLHLSNQPAIENDAERIRCIFDSLAMKYRFTLALFRSFAPKPINRLHIIGGGSRNALLNQMAADATGLEVVAGPAEATAIGNIMVQARRAGMAGSLTEMRKMIAEAVETERFVPQQSQMWDKAYARYKTATGQIE